MRFAAHESAVFAQFESAFGQIPGGGATHYLTRLMGRGRALEVLLRPATTTPTSLNGTAGSIEPCRRASSARSSGASPSASLDFPPPAYW